MPGRQQRTDTGPRLRSSVRLPWLCTALTLLLLAGAAFVALDRTVSTSAVPSAVLGSQEHLTSEYAQDLAGQLTRDGQYAAEVAGALEANPDLDQASYFSGLTGRAHPWNALQLIDTVTHRTLAAAGTLDAADAAMLAKLGRPTQTVRAVVTANGVSQVRIEVPMDSSAQVLLLTAPLALTTSAGSQATLVNGNGVVVATSGTALKSAAAGRAHALRLASSGRTGALAEAADTASPAVLSFAPVTVDSALSDAGADDQAATASGDGVAALHLSLMVERTVQAAHGAGISRSTQLRVALAAALGMLAMALFAATVLWFGLIGPIRRLARQADSLPRRGVRDLPALGGPARALGRTLHLLAVRHGDGATPSRRGARRSRLPRALGGVLILALAIAPVFGWAAAVTVAVHRAAPVEVPAQVGADQQQSTAMVAQQLREHLAAAEADLGVMAVAAQTSVAGDGSAASSTASLSSARLHALLETVLKGSPRYSSIYVLDGRGRILARSGTTPRAGAAAASGVSASAAATVVEGATSGRTPLLYARMPMADGDIAVAEFSVTPLLGTLQHTSVGTIELSDDDGRVLLSTASFTAFAPLAGTDASVARSARAGGALGTGSDVDGRALVYGNAVSTGGLMLAVTTDRATSKIGVSGVELRQSVQLLAMLAVTTALLCGGWITIMVLMPLRRLEARATRVAAGDIDEAVVPQREDEIGQLARALDLLRRAASGKPITPAKAPTSAWSQTSLLPRIQAHDPGPDETSGRGSRTRSGRVG